MKILIITLVLVLFMITSCAPVQEVPVEDSMEEVIEEETEEETISEEVTEPEVIEETEKAIQKPIEDPEIAELAEKSSKLDNYQYFYKKTTAVTSTGYKVFYFQGKILKEYTAPKKASDSLSYNKVYMDMAEKTAFVICDTSSIACKGYRLKIYPLSYAAEELPFLPHQLPMKITSDAVKKGDELVENRKTLMVEYDRSAMNLDKFSGAAMKYAVEGSDEIHTFTQLGLNSVKESDVTLPSGYEMVE